MNQLTESNESESIDEEVLCFNEVEEQKRVYIYGDHKIEVENVTSVCVRPSGGHRLNLLGGTKMIMAPGWNAIVVYGAEAWSF